MGWDNIRRVPPFGDNTVNAIGRVDVLPQQSDGGLRDSQRIGGVDPQFGKRGGVGLFAAVVVVGWLASSDVSGYVICYGTHTRVSPPCEVQFEQNDEIVGSTTTVPPAQSFEIRLRPGAYVVVVKGCPRTAVSVQGSRTELNLLCNFSYPSR